MKVKLRVTLDEIWEVDVREVVRRDEQGRDWLYYPQLRCGEERVSLPGCKSPEAAIAAAKAYLSRREKVSP